MNFKTLKIIWQAGEEGGVIPISRISRNLRLARERLRNALNLSLVYEVRYGRFQFYRLTWKGLVSYKLLKLMDKIWISEIDKDKAESIMELLDKIGEIVEGKVAKLEITTSVQVAPLVESEKEEIPTFISNNPWFSVLAKRGRE